ncbi:MAG: response regulator [Anaerolineales bacterium]|nr:response regulator [Anaerolineales bacterium]MCB0019576.1 response regulator [Anaerolineales bacterium]
MTKILVIEDDPHIRESIVDTLEYIDYEIAEAKNGVEGVAVANSFMPDLILCDVMMPEKDGYGVLLELSEDPVTSDIPFIFLTAKASREDIRKGMTLGADDYLTKPFTSQELIQAIQARLERVKRMTRPQVAELDSLRDYINLTLPHELRTPLTGISGYLHILQSGHRTMTEEQMDELLSHMQRATGRMTTLIENFIAYSQARLIHGDMEVRKKLQEHSYLSDIVGLIEQEAHEEAYYAERLADLQLDLEDATVLFYFEHMQKVLSSLLNNAFKFSPPDSPITIRSRVDGEEYVIEIIDRGRGMTAEQIASIGQNRQFERAHYEQQGTGLGLAISRLIVEIYDGTLSVESQPNVQTRVVLRLKRLDS